MLQPQCSVGNVVITEIMQADVHWNACTYVKGRWTYMYMTRLLRGPQILCWHIQSHCADQIILAESKYNLAQACNWTMVLPLITYHTLPISLKAIDSLLYAYYACYHNAYHLLLEYQCQQINLGIIKPCFCPSPISVMWDNDGLRYLLFIRACMNSLIHKKNLPNHYLTTISFLRMVTWSKWYQKWQKNTVEIDRYWVIRLESVRRRAPMQLQARPDLAGILSTSHLCHFWYHFDRVSIIKKNMATKRWFGQNFV